MQKSILPGQPWLDTTGERIQAHGGSILFVDGVFYWYGENKEFHAQVGKAAREQLQQFINELAGMTLVIS